MQAGDVQGAAGEHRAVPQCRAAHAGGAAHHPQLSYQRRLHRCAHQPADPRCALHHRPHRAAIPGGACGVSESALSAAVSCRHPRHSAGRRAVHRYIEKPSGAAGGLLFVLWFLLYAFMAGSTWKSPWTSCMASPYCLKYSRIRSDISVPISRTIGQPT